MDPLYLRKHLINQNLNNRTSNLNKTEKTDSVNITQDAKTNIKNQTENLVQDIRSEVLSPKQLKMNYLASMERSGYVKKVMELPKTLPELLMQLQNEDSIAEEGYAPKYNSEKGDGKNNQEQPKSDIREGVIRNAKETFEGVKEGVKEQIEAQKPGSSAARKEIQQTVNTEAQKPSSSESNEEIPQPSMPNLPKVEKQQPNQSTTPVNTQPNVPNKTPQNTENDSPQTPTAPQTPNQPVQNKPIEQPQVRPNMPNVPQEQPVVQNPTQNTPQQPAQPTEQPRPNVPQQPTMPEQPKPNLPQEQPSKPVNNEPVTPQPTVPQTPNQPQPIKPPIYQPEQNNPVEQPQPNMPNVPNVKPQPNTPEEPNQPVRPNIPQQYTNRPEPRPELPNYRPFEPGNNPGINNLFRPNTIIDNRAAILQNQINQNMPFLKPEDTNRQHHPHHFEDRPHRMDDTPKPENIQPQIVQNTQTEPTMTEMKQKLSGDAAELFFTGLINLNDLSSSLKDGSKSAKSKLIMAMANASRQGIDNSTINDTMKLLNASLAAEENSTPSKILKNIIELYLPWYPLQQGVGFDLSIETTPGGSESFLSTLKVWIQTRNYGNVNAILALMAGNSVDMNIKCAKLFPKDELLKRLKEETASHSMQSNINVEEIARVESYMNSEQQAKVNLSSTYELNPYLLLMAHSFIKNTIIIDSSAVIS